MDKNFKKSKFQFSYIFYRYLCEIEINYQLQIIFNKKVGCFLKFWKYGIIHYNIGSYHKLQNQQIFYRKFNYIMEKYTYLIYKKNLYLKNNFHIKLLAELKT